jgi:pimeloyl-ACP methyl ester carboxylesterase
MSVSMTTSTTKHNFVQADGMNIFYRSAGKSDSPVLLLLHGFPTSSHQFRTLIPLLSERFHVIAPDLPGFGLTEVPNTRAYQYTFDNLAKTVSQFLDALNVDTFALYVFDYGAPVGLRLATLAPQRITGLVSQNGNAYEDGLSPAWEPFKGFWAAPSDEVRNSISASFLNLEMIKWQYLTGVSQPEDIAPESYLLDFMFIERPGNRDIQMDLIQDYASNVKLYPVLVIWGKHDPFFVPAGALSFAISNPSAVVDLLETGHFALETHVSYIARRILEVL